MPLKTTKKELLAVMSKSFPIVPARTTLQVLSNFKISFSGNILEVAATDLDQSIQAREIVSGEGAFDIVVNAKKVFEITRELPEGTIYINVEENVLIIKSEKGFSCKISGGDQREFPIFPEISKITEFDIGIVQLASMIAKSSFAVSRDESRMCLCGILWELDTKKIGMVATDGHRLGSSFISGNFNIDKKISPIVSPKSLLHIIRAIGTENKDEKIHAVVGEKYVVFSNEKMRLCTKLIDGPYPDYQKAIPASNPKKAIIERTVLVDAVKRVSILSNQKTNLVKFVFKNGELEMMVLNRDIGGEARETIPVQYDGEVHSIGFNGHYLAEIVSIINTPKIRLEMNTQISACLAYPVLEENAVVESEDLFLIMPLKIIDEIE